MTNTINQSWGGRFEVPTDQFVQAFTASVSFDQRLFEHDINGSEAHAKMLAHIGILTMQELDAILVGLSEIRQEIQQDNFQWSISLEDVHMNIEARLIEKIGDAGKKLHTGRSRNDQVATDMRLYLRDEINVILLKIKQLQTQLLILAKQEAHTIMPGFTHLQVAQPVTFGHHLLAWFEMLLRDAQRLQDCRQRVNIMPLGAAALAGTSYPIDREFTAQLLNFDAITHNSLDAVSDRDFAIEFNFAAALTLTHLSRFSEELILWSSQQFDFVEIGDNFCTGSSIMPQKKNPDVPELIRGKTGRAYGNLMALLTLMKAQPLAYNKDNQEDKEPLFDSIDTLKASLHVFAEMIPSISVHRDKMLNATTRGFATATDLADYLVRKGVAFRDAHEIVGKAVALAIKQQQDLSDLKLEALQVFSVHIQRDVFDVLKVEGACQARNHLGGTAPEQVLKAIEQAYQRMNDY